MKLELLLRKAAPFLLIAILIACLFNMPQKEGMKSAKHWFEEHKGEHVADVAGGAALGGAAVWVGKQFYDSHQLAKEMNAEDAANRSSAATVDRMNSISRKVFGDTSEFTQKAADYSKYADDADDADHT